MKLTVHSVPCLRDNYAYLLRCEASGAMAVVDPSEAGPVLDAAADCEGELVAIWNTHHHWDHTGGNLDLLAAQPNLEVLGHESDRGRIPGQTQFLADGDAIKLGQLSGTICHIPAHTTGAIAYLIGDEVFTGDTLFLAGCGRLFEGTPAMMFESLARLAAHCDDRSRLWVGHEYTASNLRFAAAAEPDNADIKEALARALTQEQTIPGTWSQELATNPFVRAATAEELGRLRAWKDEF